MGGQRTKDLKCAQKYSKGSNILKRERVTGTIGGEYDDPEKFAPEPYSGDAGDETE